MNDKDDQQWLDALAGKPDTSAAAATNAQATALRTAMMVRRAELELGRERTDSAEFRRLQDRLRREGLLPNTNAEGTKKQSGSLKALLGNWLPWAVNRSTSLPLWSLAANVVLGVAVVLQLGMFSDEADPDVLRGGTATILLATDPESRLAEITAGLDQVDAHYVVLRKNKDELQLLVQADPAALDYFLSRRIEPNVNSGVIDIVLSKPRQ